MIYETKEGNILTYEERKNILEVKIEKIKIPMGRRFRNFSFSSYVKGKNYIMYIKDNFY